jgi:hypothetical protein
VLYILHEQIHWSLLITGFILADHPPETPYPMHNWHATSNLATQIAATILTFFDSMTDETNDKWSPLVMETLYWWFQRWGYTYFFSETEVPGGGDWAGLARWAVGRMRRDVEGWVAEKDVIAQVSVFRTLY